MILINERVNGCSLFEDNSQRLLDASTVTHRARTLTPAQRVPGAGVPANRYAHRQPQGVCLCSQGEHAMAQSHTQQVQGFRRDTGCWRTHSQSPGTSHTAHTTHHGTLPCTVNKYHVTNPTTHSTQSFRDPEFFSIQWHLKHEGKSGMESYGCRYSFIPAQSRTSGPMYTRNQGRAQRRESWPPTGKKKERETTPGRTQPLRWECRTNPFRICREDRGPMDRQTHPDQFRGEER